MNQMPKINQEEYEVLKEAQEEGYKWIARNYNGALIIYTSKPMKNPNLYWDGFGKRMDDRLFKFIQWEDEEPHNVAELIEEYESEETEVKKNIEWLKSAIQQNLDFYNDNDEEWQMAKVRAYAKSLDLINQLDEPEVLSQEWIDKHKESWQDLSITGYSVPEKDLQNLLVPKQEDMFNGQTPEEGEVYFAVGFDGAVEISVARSIDEAIETLTEYGTKYAVVEKPVIPKEVGERIEREITQLSLYRSLNYAYNYEGVGEDERMIDRWIVENTEEYAQAWLNGFTVEKHPKLLAKVKGWEQYVDFVGVIYWGIDDETDRLTFADRDQALAITKKDWEELGITEKNADFINYYDYE